MQDEIEGINVAAEFMCFSGEASRETEKGDNEKYPHAEEVVINYIDDFKRILIASVRVTEKKSLKTGIQQRKHKH